MQPVDFFAGVVKRERGARRAGDAKSLHERLRAVMPGPYRDPQPIQHRPGVVGMNLANQERDNGGLLGRGADKTDPVNVGQALGGVGQQFRPPS